MKNENGIIDEQRELKKKIETFLSYSPYEICQRKMGKRGVEFKEVN